MSSPKWWWKIINLMCSTQDNAISSREEYFRYRRSPFFFRNIKIGGNKPDAWG